MNREIALDMIIRLFQKFGYFVERKTKEVENISYDIIEAFLSNPNDFEPHSIYTDIFAISTIVYNKDKPRNHICEFYNGKDGVLMSQIYDKTGDVFLLELKHNLERKGLAW